MNKVLGELEYRCIGLKGYQEHKYIMKRAFRRRNIDEGRIEYWENKHWMNRVYWENTYRMNRALGE